MMLINSRHIAGYCCPYETGFGNIVSVEEQKASIRDYVKNHIPGAELTVFEDHFGHANRFDKRKGYAEMRMGLDCGQFDTVVFQSFSGFSQPGNRELVEMERLRESDIRIISIDDMIDFPNIDFWLKIQIWFIRS